MSRFQTIVHKKESEIESITFVEVFDRNDSHDARDFTKTMGYVNIVFGVRETCRQYQ